MSVADAGSRARGRGARGAAARALAFLCAPAFVLLESPACALDGDGPSPSWTVRRDPSLRGAPVEDVERHATEALRWALARVSRELGTGSGPLAVRWTLDFSKPPTPRETGSALAWGPRDLEAGTTRWLGEGEGGLEVVVWGRRFLWSPAEVRTVVAHEVAHAQLAATLGSRARYAALPPWLREGLAIWLSGEGPGALDDALALAAFSEGRADRCLRGIPPRGEEGAGASRADAYVAFAWLESRIGSDGVRAFARAIAGGRPPRDALWNVVGVSLLELRAASLAWGRARIAARLPPEREARFVESLQLRRDGRIAAAASRWRELLRQDPAGPLRDTLRYLLAKEELSADRTERAEPTLRELLGSSSTLWRAESLVLLGRLRGIQGRSFEAAAAFRAVLDGYWDEPGPARRAREGLQDLATEQSTGR